MYDSIPISSQIENFHVFNSISAKGSVEEKIAKPIIQIIKKRQNCVQNSEVTL